MPGRIFMNQFDLEFVRKCIYYLFRFALPEESVIYKYAGQFVPNRFMDKDRGNRTLWSPTCCRILATAMSI